MTRRKPAKRTDVHEAACKEAAYRMWQVFEMEGLCVELSENPKRPAWEKLPINVFMDEMSQRKRPPKIIFQAPRLGSNLWTESLTAYVYAGIEQAFTRAARMPGGNHYGYARELKSLKDWAENQITTPQNPLPDNFVAKTARLFAEGILEERRSPRVELLNRIDRNWPSNETDLRLFIDWISDDLSDERLNMNGRPADYQRIIFAAQIANLWNTLTGEEIARNPESYFARFVVACWKTGFPDGATNANFTRIIRHHLEEDPNPNPCRRCDCCRNSEKCDRKRYFGTLT